MSRYRVFMIGLITAEILGFYRVIFP